MNKAKTLIVLVCSCILTLMMPLGAHAQEEEAADIHARYSAAADLQTMQVLYEQDAQKRMYPASLTKVLTVLTAMDEIDDLEEDLRTQHINRLAHNECSAARGVIFLDMLSNIERISDHANNVVGYVADEKEG